MQCKSIQIFPPKYSVFILAFTLLYAPSQAKFGTHSVWIQDFQGNECINMLGENGEGKKCERKILESGGGAAIATFTLHIHQCHLRNLTPPPQF